MNFDGLDPGMGEYPPSLHGALDARMESSLDPHLNPALLQGVELDPEGLAGTVPEPVHLMEGMFSELHSVVSEVGIPVTATHFDLQEEMLWMGNHRVRALTMNLVSVLLSFSFIYFFLLNLLFFFPKGHVTSFFGPAMDRYSSFQAHAADDVRHIQSLETGVLFLSKSNLKCHTRGGLVMFEYP